jgi:hypothetical protein
MTTAYEGPDNPNNFLPTTENFPKEGVEFSNRLHEIYVDIARNVNSREISRYELTEMLNGQTFYDLKDNQNRKYVYRKCFSFGVIAGGATLLIPHGIKGLPDAGHPSNKTILTRIYGTYLDTTYYQKPIPYTAFSVPNIGYQFDIKIDSTNIVLVNGTVGTAIPTISGQVVLEYLKN